jgi:radical SAM protein with 4Fe4S-binding SPASM domain
MSMKNILKFYAYNIFKQYTIDIFYRKLHYVPPLPLMICVEVTNYCNARCIMCDRPSMSRREGYIDWDLYCYIIDQIANYGIRRVRLNRFGEPLLHPQLIDMIRYAKNKGIKEVNFVTNGMLLNEKIARGIIDAGLDRICISIDGAKAETFEKVRVGCKLSRISENVFRLIELRKSKGLTKPYVQINTLILQDTLHELQTVIEKWKPHVDRIRLFPALQYGNLNLSSIMPREAIERNPLACPELFFRMVIFWNGDVTVCCEDINGEMITGNIRKDPIKKLWKNEKITKIRKKHFKGDFSFLPVCKGCDLSNRNMVKFLDKQMEYYSKQFELYVNVPY